MVCICRDFTEASLHTIEHGEVYGRIAFHLEGITIYQSSVGEWYCPGAMLSLPSCTKDSLPETATLAFSAISKCYFEMVGVRCTPKIIP